ncbi:hypothetical protein GOC19_30655 [Sinorhizobium meliloti]|uniref:hypothetical protein n=1 Tax=Rhizobium meliloti TaxID=382 RepID=UPI000FD40226|nr:hypothetical protein [Sinorhizobium meliloti]MDW9825259.1 hypothetical protein [Sinorhizobium meliloti]MDW9868749.1 hypothetical protein [Sinorhizobium meliloti]MDX0060698.1 hypothetical protein [Sinorhizobium meliloti]RVG50299.1 hypothetical protein CN224_29555 [Sinorhizobium meliloti]RVL74828.1 hypothetical protein CN135_25655 [Sinorhizobium meliloti]
MCYRVVEYDLAYEYARQGHHIRQPSMNFSVNSPTQNEARHKNMNKQKSPRKLSKIACACLLSGSLLAGSAHAVTPDDHSILSNFWTTANLIKETFDWRGWAGWGSVGATNMLITAATGESDGAFTKTVFTNLCGATAAGFVAAWKPADGPGAASHIKAIVKAGAVVGVSSACGWATQAILKRTDSEIRAAHKAIENAKKNNKPNYDEIVDDKTKVNNAFLAMEKNYRDTALALNNAAYWSSEWRRNGCSPRTQSTLCDDLERRRIKAQAEAEGKLLAFNDDGRTMSANVKELGNDVKS